MEKNMEYRFVLCAALMFGLMACQHEELEIAQKPQDEEIVPVEVSLRLNQSAFLPGTVQTKDIDEPVTADYTHIKNLCIFQYDGTAENSKLVGDVHYLSVDASPDNTYEQLDFDQIRLAESFGKEHTLVIFANTFKKFARVETLGEMKTLVKNISCEQDLFEHDGSEPTPDKEFPEDRTYYQRLNGVAVTKIRTGQEISASLERSMARIKIKIENTGKDGLVINSVQLRNIPVVDHYFTNNKYKGSNGETQYMFGTDFKDISNIASSLKNTYPVITPPEPDPETGEQTGEFTCYVPANMRGTDESCTLATMKNISPNKTGATHIYIVASYGTNNSKLISYCFYLGENLTNNFDIKPNTSYSYTFKFDGKGDASIDYRVEELGGCEFDVDANCYMLVTPSVGENTYSFNVVHRPNVFWGTSKADRYGLHANTNYSNNNIAVDEEWHARILWSDFPMTPEEAMAFLAKREGNGGGDYYSDNQRVKVTVPAGMEGNVVIGVYTDDPDNILWSWHFWITPYRPNDAAKLGISPSKYVYGVRGGDVHRYGESYYKTWTEGRYKYGFSMDRNVGALDQKYHPTSERGCGIYYQFGRKDPFHKGTTYMYDNEFVYQEEQNIVSNKAYEIEASEIGGAHVPYAVNNPTIYINSSYTGWTYGDIFCPTTIDKSIVWQDPNAYDDGTNSKYLTENMPNEENRFITGRPGMVKSIFDPCPPGWILPDIKWITPMSSNNCKWDIESSNGYGRGYGTTYYPGGYSIAPETETIFFPSYNCWKNPGRVVFFYSCSTLWSKSPGREYDNAQFLYIAKDRFYPIYDDDRFFGLPIRCVTE